MIGKAFWGNSLGDGSIGGGGPAFGAPCPVQGRPMRDAGGLRPDSLASATIVGGAGASLVVSVCGTAAAAASSATSEPVDGMALALSLMMVVLCVFTCRVYLARFTSH